jgi:uncharacterized membrane protein
LRGVPGNQGGAVQNPGVACHARGTTEFEKTTSSQKDWLMKRNCSLSPRQVGRFYLSILLVSVAIALVFAWKGIWIILAFALLEMVLLGGALLLYARHAADYERVVLARGALVVEAVSANRLERHEFNARWVRVEMDLSPRAELVLHSGRLSVSVGRYLDPGRRRGFARELSWWLQCSR